MTELNAPEQTWQQVLNQLQMQMTQATFDTWVKNTCIVSQNNGQLVIGAKNAFAKDWLQNRLSPTIERCAANILGHPVELEFIVAPAPDPNPTSDLGHSQSTIHDSPFTIFSPDPGLSFAQETDFHKIWLKKGYAQVPHYVTEFWIPFLKPAAFALWKYLDSTDTSDVKIPANRWTPPDYYRQRRLANRLGSKGRRIVAGGMSECAHSQNARLAGCPVEECCDRHAIHRLKPDQENLMRCYYWRPGALEILYREKLLALEIDDSSPSPKGHKMQLQVFRVFPILTPHQVGQLSEYLQDQHQHWLKAHERLLGLTYQDWQTITAKTLVSHQPAYHDYRTLFGHYEFNRILAELIETGQVLAKPNSSLAPNDTKTEA